MAVLMFLEGVLRNSNQAPIQQGMLLYHSLKEKNRVLLLCSDKDKDDNWLRQNKINKYDDLVGYENIPALGDHKEYRQVEYVQSQGPVDFVITADPLLAAMILTKGITTLLFSNPVYISEAFRPDSRKGSKAWQSIVDEISKQQDMIKEDPRLS